MLKAMLQAVVLSDESRFSEDAVEVVEQVAHNLCSGGISCKVRDSRRVWELLDGPRSSDTSGECAIA